jgi:tetratricopeptide (TPR) repeat protein
MGAAEWADMGGDAAWAKGDFAEADYRKTVAAWPEDSEALYGLGQCIARQGDAAIAAAYYRQGVYKSYGLPPKLVLDESLSYRLMEYALLLQQAGEKDEALRIYQHAVGLLNFRDGKPNLKVPLPEFGARTHPTPAQFQAMALVGIAVDLGWAASKRAIASLDQAAALAPDSPIPYFYRAKHNSGYDDRTESARADIQKAIHLGDPQTAEEAQQKMKSLPPPPH